MSTALRKSGFTPEEYLAWERQQTVRHEYYAGEVFSQAGGTRRHSLIGMNLAREVSSLLRGHPCEAHGSDMRIHVEATGYYAYPDLSVVCPPIEGGADDVISNPVLIAEVLSPSTADFDRGGKFGHYRRIPSMKEYLIFLQDEPRVEQHTRTGEGHWLLREIVGLDATIEIETLQKALALKAVYEKVTF